MYGIQIQSHVGISQYQQLYRQLRDKILQGTIAPATKLPSSRQFSQELNLSRNIVLEVIDQLKVEGFLETRKGSGTFVLPSLTYREGFSQAVFTGEEKRKKPALSLIAGIPELDLFPRRAWDQCYRHRMEYSTSQDLGYTPPLGRKDLREALAAYLYRTKGIQVKVENLIITAGAAQALAILAQWKDRKRILLEDPIASFIPEIFKSHHCELDYLAVDEQGIRPESLPKGKFDWLYVSPSHQFPLGGTLSAQRRVEILNWAAKNQAYIIEDDYDGEYRYEQRPIAPIQSLAPHRVIYLGTFSKILSPALRMGYMVVPPKLLDEVKRIKGRWDLFNEGLNQMAMAKFIQDGHLDRHLRKMLRHYRKKKILLEESIKDILGKHWKILGNTTGLHLVLQRKGFIFDENFSQALKDRNVSIIPVKSYSIHNKNHWDKIVMGYGHQSLEDLKTGLAMIKEVFEEFQR